MPDLNGSLSPQPQTALPVLFWLLGSVLICTLATNALWLARFFAPQPQASAASGPACLPVRMAPGRWLWQVCRFLYYLGIPYLVLGGWPLRPFQGLLSLQDMGFVGLDGSWTVTRWLGAAGTGLGVGSVALVILILARRHANNVPRFPYHPWWAIVIDVAYLEVHWAFYRAALAVLLGDLYLGVFAGLGLVYAEWAVNPFWRQGWRSTPLRFGDWRQESLAAGQWLRAALALVIAVLFLFTQNLWICLAAHWLLELVFYSHNRQKAHSPPAVVG